MRLKTENPAAFARRKSLEKLDKNSEKVRNSKICKKNTEKSTAEWYAITTVYDFNRL